MKFPPFISVANPQSFLSQAELLPDYWLQLASTNSEIVVTPLVRLKGRYIVLHEDTSVLLS